MASRKIQNEDVKSASDLTGAGGTIAQLINDTKIYISADSLNKSLFSAIEDGDLSGGAGGVGAAGVSTTKTANYTVVSGDNKKIIPVDTSGGAVTITLPAPSSGFLITIKDLSYTASTNNISIDRNGGNIDDVDSDDVITEDGKALTYVSDGTDWIRIASFMGDVLVGEVGIAVWGGGNDGGDSNIKDTVNIAVGSNATDFGDLSLARNQLTGLGSATRGVFAGGLSSGSVVDTIDYFTFTVNATSTDFGDLTQTRRNLGALSNDTRGVFGGGTNAAKDTFYNAMDYITIASVGNATAFGDLNVTGNNLAGVSSTTRGVFGPREISPGGSYDNSMDYITIASTGNATDFGNATTSRRCDGGTSSDVRGLFMGGYDGSFSNIIDYITIASAGNATDFGDLTQTVGGNGATSSKIKAISGGGSTGSASNVIESVVIATTGNATDFGDLTVARSSIACCGSNHGGIA